MSRHGYLEIGAGSTLSALTGQTVDWYEKGSVFDAFAGLTIQNINGKGCASFGKYYPSSTSRLFIKAFFDSTIVTDALVAVSSWGGDLFRVRNNSTVGIVQANPKERLHIGELMTFHDGGGKFMGFNAYWDGTANQMKNIVGDRVSVTMGIGPGSSSPFTILVDQNNIIGQIMNSGFKGLSILSNGNLGVGTPSPGARLAVQSSGNTNSTDALSVTNSSATLLAVIRDDGSTGIGTSSPSARLDVKGGGTISSTFALAVTNGTPTNILRVRDDGKVIIGTGTITSGSHTDFKLSVDGKVVAKHYVCTTGVMWADDVFEDGYALMPLTTLKEYITEKGHLPGVPTATEVEKDGFDVAAITTVLLRKIEELTLHLIDLESRYSSLLLTNRK